eukprot:scaffold223040_cov32-Tisochrysis_lutea.AAC.1
MATRRLCRAARRRTCERASKSAGSTSVGALVNVWCRGGGSVDRRPSRALRRLARAAAGCFRPAAAGTAVPRPELAAPSAAAPASVHRNRKLPTS